MENIKKLEVFYNEKKVGTLASLPNNITAFEYDKEWLINGFSISPFSLPLKNKVFTSKIDPFNGLFGVFADSLPDGWGRLLVDRILNKNGIRPAEINSLNRLAIVGNSGMGALTYKPTHNLISKEIEVDFDKISFACQEILKTDFSSELDKLFLLGGSSGGARPKILTEIDGEDWIVKFPSSQDPKDIGEIEYLYSVCAKKCGLIMPETKLFSSKISKGYFGIKRFDRNLENKKRIHMISVSGLLETSHRLPNLDYNDLMKLTLTLTNDFQEVEKMFRLMCFNIFAHNRDDHSKNFSFIYNDLEKKWELSPAYDLTYSYSIAGEHATTVNGNGKNPSIYEILEVAKKIGMNLERAKKIANEIEKIIKKELGEITKKLTK